MIKTERFFKRDFYSESYIVCRQKVICLKEHKTYLKVYFDNELICTIKCPEKKESLSSKHGIAVDFPFLIDTKEFYDQTSKWINDWIHSLPDMYKNGTLFCNKEHSNLIKVPEGMTVHLIDKTNSSTKLIISESHESVNLKYKIEPSRIYSFFPSTVFNDSYSFDSDDDSMLDYWSLIYNQQKHLT